MKKLFLVFIFLIFASANAQKGETILYFKNGDTISGIGKLKGTEFINFKAGKRTPYKKISFKNLDRAEVTLKDTVISYRLFPITKKNGEKKTPSVIGQFENGKVNLYVKGEIKKIGLWSHSTPNSFGSGMSFGGTTDSVVHYFLRKDNEPDAVHIGSSFSNESVLKNTEKIFSECPELLKKILAESVYGTSIFEVISKYNHRCGQ